MPAARCLRLLAFCCYLTLTTACAKESVPPGKENASKTPAVKRDHEHEHPPEEKPNNGAANETKGSEPNDEESDMAPMDVKVEPFGTTPDGGTALLYTLTSGKGVTAKITDYGGILVSLRVPDPDGKAANVVLGYDTIDEYVKDPNFFGATVGRYANRIAKGKFKLGDKEYSLAANDEPNHLHGGPTGFHKRLWKSELQKTPEMVSVVLAYTSEDGEEGYPGKVDATVTYSLTDDNALVILYEATADKETPINMTHHSYFNLAGHDSGDILKHELAIEADKYLPVDETLIPTGELAAVAGTPFDFREPKPIGKDIAETPGLFDHCYAVRNEDAHEGALAHVARVSDPESGRTLDIFSDQPGVQFYTANHLDGVKGAKGATYNKHQAFCLETQHYPDSPNQPDFPSTILKPGETYRTTTLHHFGTE